MTDKEKIREEVERLQKELVKEKEKGFGSDVDDACILELQNVLIYIDSLQEEPVSNDLKEAAKNHKSAIHIVSPQWTSEVEKAFKAGAEWQKEQIIDKACEWLEEHLLDFWSQRITNTDYFIEDFKKAMEE